MKIDFTLKDIFSNTLNTKRIVILLTLFFSIAFYYYLVDFYATDFSIFSYLPIRRLPSYAFYSGSERLNYYLVGSYLERAFPNNIVQNKPTKGGIDNAAKVLTSTSPSYGLVQEDVLKADDFMRTQLNFAAPIYLERMHIIYDRNAFRKYQKGDQDNDIPQISTYTSPELLDFFAHAKISIGPVGSGTKIIASYIMDAINEQIRARQADLASSIGHIRGDPARGPQVLTTDTSKVLRCLNGEYTVGNEPSDTIDCKDGPPDIVFVVTGSPCKSIKDLIMDKSDRYRLISIDSTFISKLNLKHSTNFRITDFNCRYDRTRCGKMTSAVVGDVNYNGVTTLGTYAYLVTDQRALTIDILAILNRLNAVKNNDVENKFTWTFLDRSNVLKLWSRNEIIKNEGDNFLADVLRDDFDFLDYYEKQSHGRLMLSLRNLLVFLVTLGTTFTPSFIFLSWLVSGIQQMKYMTKLSKIIEESIPINEEHEETDQGETDDTDGVAKNGVGKHAMTSLRDERWPILPGWIPSSINRVREFIRSGKVTMESPSVNVQDRKYLRPKINDDQSQIINKVITGLINLNNLRRDISKDTGVNETHTTFLIGRIDQIVEKLRKSLGIRLNGVIENHDQEVNDILLLKYLTADWITKDDYEWLITKLRKG